MPLTVRPIPTLDDRINDIRMRTAEIVNDDILPNERNLWRSAHGGAVETAAAVERTEVAALTPPASCWPTTVA